ncbi:MAG: PAS domain S-box protein [Candidatus Hydrogenedentota bacterium]|nr:MAG: PAS domain S-box protein [Candidatus Hydrogenedentota bacterium]
MEELEAELVGNRSSTPSDTLFDLKLCHQGDEAVEAVRLSIKENKPFAVVFLDVRISPGPDGVWTAEHIRALDPYVEIVIVTGYSDVDPSDISRRVQPADRLLYLQKPLYPQEIRQLASSLSAKWSAEMQLREAHDELERRVGERTSKLSRLNEQLKQDIVKRKRAEEALRESEEKYRVLVENANEGITVIQDGMLKFVNAKTTEVAGYSKKELISRPFVEFIHPDDQEMVMEQHLRRLRGEELPHIYSFRIVDKEGTIKWMETIGVLVTWEGKPAVLAFLTDITESKRLSHELQKSHGYLEGLLENANDIIIICDRTGKIISANKMAVQVSGFEADEWPGRNILDIIAPEFVEATRQWAYDWMRGNRAAPVLQLEFKTVSGERIPVEASLNIIESAGGVVGVQAIARDLRPRLEAEQQIRELQTLNEQIIRNAPIGIATFDNKGTFTSVNPAYARIMGRDSPRSLLGKNLRDFETAKKFHHDQDFDRVLKGETIEGVYEFRGVETGKEVCVGAFATPLLDENGDTQGVLLMVADLFQQKKLERQLVQSEKLSTIGTLVSGVAHELNNPLTAIMGYSQLLSINKDLSEGSLDMTQKIQASAERCKKIVENLLSFARRKPPQKSEVDINNLLDQTLELREYDLRVSNIRIKKSYHTKMRPTAGDPDQLQQVFLNLINNSFDAMHEANGQGVLEIRTYESSDNFINIEFIDNGPGIDESIREKIFDPFVTTKPPGKGTGLGLSLSYGIIQAHGGSIELDELYQRGTRFILRLPAASVEPEGAQIHSQPERMPAGEAKHILLVDDEEEILKCARMLLEKHLFQVTTALSGGEAKRILALKSFDAVVTDLRMPGTIDGRALYHHILKEKPDLAPKVIFITGDMLDIETENFLGKFPNRHVKKPFTSQELIDSITAVTST